MTNFTVATINMVQPSVRLISLHGRLSACWIRKCKYLSNPDKRRTIAPPLGRDMVCPLQMQSLIYILPPALQWCMQYIVILNRVITALNCTKLFDANMFRLAEEYVALMCPDAFTNEFEHGSWCMTQANTIDSLQNQNFTAAHLFMYSKLWFLDADITFSI